MLENLEALYQILYTLVGHHRKLLELVRIEKEAILDCDLSKIQDFTFQKEAFVQMIQEAEHSRLRVSKTLLDHFQGALAELTLPSLVKQIQGVEPEMANKLSSIHSTLKLLIKRISEQNIENNRYVEHSLEHLQKMRENTLGSLQESNVYNRTGKKEDARGEAKLISQKI